MRTFFQAMNKSNVPSKGMSAKIVNTPSGPFTWNEALEKWQNVNNGMLLESIALREMFIYDYDTLEGGGDDSACVTAILPEYYIGTEEFNCPFGGFVDLSLFNNIGPSCECTYQIYRTYSGPADPYNQDPLPILQYQLNGGATYTVEFGVGATQSTPFTLPPSAAVQFQLNIVNQGVGTPWTCVYIMKNLTDNAKTGLDVDVIETMSGLEDATTIIPLVFAPISQTFNSNDGGASYTNASPVFHIMGNATAINLQWDIIGATPDAIANVKIQKNAGIPSTWARHTNSGATFISGQTFTMSFNASGMTSCSYNIRIFNPASPVGLTYCSNALTVGIAASA